MNQFSTKNFNLTHNHNGWLAFLLAAIIVVLVLVLVLFNQYSKWWFDAIFSELFTATPTVVNGNDMGVDFIYVLVFGAVSAVVIGFKLLTAPVLDDDNDWALRCNEKPRIPTRLSLKRNPFSINNPHLCQAIKADTDKVQEVLAYIDTDLPVEGNVWQQIDDYFTHYQGDICLVAPARAVSRTNTPVSLHSQIYSMEQHGVSQPLSDDIQILIIGEPRVFNTISYVCRQFHPQAKFISIH